MVRHSLGRSGEYAEQHLAGWHGALQTDAFAGFNRLYADGSTVEVGCWAHARRKFYDLYVKNEDDSQHRGAGAYRRAARHRSRDLRQTARC